MKRFLCPFAFPARKNSSGSLCHAPGEHTAGTARLVPGRGKCYLCLTGQGKAGCLALATEKEQGSWSVSMMEKEGTWLESSRRKQLPLPFLLLLPCPNPVRNLLHLSIPIPPYKTLLQSLTTSRKENVTIQLLQNVC